MGTTSKASKPAAKAAPAKKTPAQILAEHESRLKQKYPHIVSGTLRFEKNANKYSVEAKLEDGVVERLYTSDLFQVKVSRKTREAQRAQRIADMKAKRAAAAAAKKAKAAKKPAKAPAKKAATAKKARPAKAAPAPAAAAGDFQ